MNSKPQISVVIPAYNEEERIVPAIESVKKQEMDNICEIIVVDNNSKDNTAELAKKNGAKVVPEKTQGLTFTRQAGLLAAKGELLVYMDADTRMPRGWLKKVYDYFDVNPDVVGMSCKLRFYDESSTLEKSGLFVFDKILTPFTLFLLKITNKPEILLGPIMAIRRQALLDAGGIDTNFIFYGEDTSLAYVLYSQGDVKYRRDLYVNTSARRYKEKGAFKILFIYFYIFLLIHLRFYNTALNVSNKYAAKHRNIYSEPKEQKEFPDIIRAAYRNAYRKAYKKLQQLEQSL